MEEFWNQPSSLWANTAVILPDGGKVTYGELYHRADTFASQLPERSFLVMKVDNDLLTICAYLACLRHDHVALLLSRDLKDNLLDDLIERYKPDYLYSVDEGGHYSLTPLFAKEHQGRTFHPDLSLLLSTSGSTGSPKLVRLTKKNLLQNARSIADYLELTATERPITNLPFYYSYGLSILNSHLQVGAALLLTKDSLVSPAFWKFYVEGQATSLAGVPYTYDMLEAVAFRKRSVSSLRYMTQAGGHMSSDMVLRYASWAKERGIRFYVMYGQTEATARMSYLPPHLAEEHPGSIGYAIPGGEFSLMDDDGNLISDCNEEGELVYKGANVCMGYASSREDLLSGDVNQGVLHTGDIAKRDEQGLFYITGRLKRFLKIAGNRFALDELEEQFLRRGIHAVCGGTDNRLLVAVTEETSKKEAEGFLKSTWHLMKTQYRVFVVESIPRSETGKVLYEELFKSPSL